MRNETKDKVLAYESKLESSFDLVLREAEELYQGQGQLMWFNFSSLVLHFFARITNSDQCLIHNGDIFTGILGHKFAKMFNNPKVISPSPNPSHQGRGNYPLEMRKNL
jgi:hypothetical protein